MGIAFRLAPSELEDVEGGDGSVLCVGVLGAMVAAGSEMAAGVDDDIAVGDDCGGLDDADA